MLFPPARISRIGSLILLLVLGLGIAACSADAEAPEALVSYLDALVQGNVQQAYERTQLAQIGSFTRAAALSQEHFTAFFEADPVTGYDIGRVVAFRPEGQDPFWEVEVTVRSSTGTRVEDFQIEGEVLGVVTVEPVVLLVEVPDRGVPTISVDGISVDVSDARLAAKDRTWQVLILNGRHRLAVGDRTVEFMTSPPQVITGEGSSIGAADPTGARLTLVIG